MKGLEAASFCVLTMIVVGALVLIALYGCTSQPSCLDNPRNMRCMDAAQLKKELKP